MCMQSREERGAILVMTAIFSVVLIGIAALALDAGRLFVLHSEMHNAADAAALAAAAELDGQSDAQARAKAAARGMLSHSGHFAKNNELLKEALPDEAFTFYCAIGSEYDIDSSAACPGGPVSEGSRYYLADGDSDTHYVKVNMQSNASDYYVIDLFFLPVLELITDDVALTAAAHAEATAGRNYLICNYPPLMICDPFEGSGSFKNVMVPGHQIQLKLQQHGGWWVPGDFAFLEPTGGSGAMDLADYIADEIKQECTPPIVTTKPGNNTGPTTWAVNTRFDEYEQTSHFDWPEFPPAPIVIDYPRDSSFTNRVGNGNWDRSGYWTTYHATQGHGASPPSTLNLGDGTGVSYATASRWQVYNWEIEQNLFPCHEGYVFTDKKGDPIGGQMICSQPNPSAAIPKKEVLPAPVLDGKPDPAHINSGSYPPPQTIPTRRLMHIATLSCQELGINGKATVSVISPDGFARVFITEHTGDEEADLTGEYIGWTDEKEENYHVDIQLYE